MRIETLAVHSGRVVDTSTGAVTPPIHMATTFQRAPDGSYPHGYIYSRSGNPTRESLEQCLGDLEGGAAAAAFSSGMAAIMSVFQALSPGDHIIAPKDIYHGTKRLLREIMAPWNLKTTFVDMTDLWEVRQTIKETTKLIFVETPSNPLLKITDVKAVADLAHGAGAWCLCDNTWATPVLQRPLELGADLVVHSSTKYLGGHGDVTGGAVVTGAENDLFGRIRRIQQDGGAVPSPFDCWLVLRGVRTLPYRMRAHSNNAENTAAFLKGHPRVTAVHYPGLESHPGYDTVRKQMSMGGGMLSFQVAGGMEEAFRIAAKSKLFTRATSLGSYESLIEHRASVEGPETDTPDDLLRLSLGLEHPDDLIKDLEQALAI